MRRIRYPLLVCLGAAFFAASPPAASAPAPGAASAFVRDLGDRVIEAQGAPDHNAALRGLLDRKFDMRLIGRFVVGRHWRRAGAAQRRDYLALFREYTARTYARRLGGEGGEALEVLSERALDNGRDTLVQARIQRPHRKPVEIILRIRETKEGLRVIDVGIEGVSLLVTQREEFGSILRQHGMDGLLERLRARIAELSAQDG